MEVFFQAGVFAEYPVVAVNDPNVQLRIHPSFFDGDRGVECDHAIAGFHVCLAERPRNAVVQKAPAVDVR